jgi:hypothetical protein
MRIIDGIPEKDLIEFYLGDLVKIMTYRESLAFSPSIGKNTNIGTYEKYTNVQAVRVYYSKTKNVVRVSLKVQAHGMWETIKRIDTPAADPRGPEKVQKIIRRYLDFSNRHTSAEKSEN